MFRVWDYCDDVTQLPAGATLWPAGYSGGSWWLVWDGQVLCDSNNGFGPYGTKGRRTIRSLPEYEDRGV